MTALRFCRPDGIRIGYALLDLLKFPGLTAQSQTVAHRAR